MFLQERVQAPSKFHNLPMSQNFIQILWLKVIVVENSFHNKLRRGEGILYIHKVTTTFKLRSLRTKNVHELINQKEMIKIPRVGEVNLIRRCHVNIILLMASCFGDGRLPWQRWNSQMTSF